MTSNRPYRSAVEPEIAINELKRQTGYMFDPVVVNAFFQILSGGMKMQSNSLSSVSIH